MHLHRPPRPLHFTRLVSLPLIMTEAQCLIQCSFSYVPWLTAVGRMGQIIISPKRIYFRSILFDQYKLQTVIRGPFARVFAGQMYWTLRKCVHYANWTVVANRLDAVHPCCPLCL